MATPAQVLSDAAAALASTTGGSRLASDYRTDLETIPAGQTRFQLNGGSAGEDATRSDIARTIMRLAVAVHHRLADPDAERAYTEGAMQTALEAIIKRTYWRNLAAVFEVVSPIDYTVERELNVITYTVELEVSVV